MLSGVTCASSAGKSRFTTSASNALATLRGRCLSKNTMAATARSMERRSRINLSCAQEKRTDDDRVQILREIRVGFLERQALGLVMIEPYPAPTRDIMTHAAQPLESPQQGCL